MTATDFSAGVERRPGRPRDEGLAPRILDAVVALIDEGAEVTTRAVVARSGVSKAAIYRRWPSLVALTAEALDRGRRPLDERLLGTAKDAIRISYGMDAADLVGDYPESRMRRRLQLGLADSELQRTYWQAHAARRRIPMAAVLTRAIESGELRADTDTEAVLDILSGTYYYQLVVRGESPSEPSTLARCRAAVDVVWRGIATEPGALWPGG
ncbi:TetR/AcrR family transcriptional regulator [Salinibacterium sp. dk2585]|uniref:TetR/AcrR family transcriptional regulator n=1 Tax=unclassified Salinibacterium TaxID=2632331 RepID=UPI0011C24DBE|nr:MULTISPECIES: TetR/AcrR family transcriptional regulator [unclassified Salinibacterium]QEE60565.1 TetR/AcrR family transcriptional regulator [Salinibacterium sp. dk2585]TXK55637.1 TetR/AcrR family transcriptional regulator [Salinibacterium sp. dk5596]